MMQLVKGKHIWHISAGFGMVLLLIACSGNDPVEELDFETRFNRGKKYLEDEKYLKAQGEFKYIVISGAHTEWGDDAMFYLGESYFQNEEYLLAISEFDRLIRRLRYSPYVEKARWRICQSYVEESPKYYHDQAYTEKALSKLQEFLDDYPKSDYRDDAENTIVQLRKKLAKKLYETGILYIKLSAYDSAVMALEELLESYYDTEYAEKAYVEIIHCYSLMQEIQQAEDYYTTHEQLISSTQMRQKAREYIDDARQKMQ